MSDKVKGPCFVRAILWLAVRVMVVLVSIAIVTSITGDHEIKNTSTIYLILAPIALSEFIILPVLMRIIRRIRTR